MTVHEIAGAPTMQDVLLWDSEESEWRIGHGRELDYMPGRTYWCACTVAEGNEIVSEQEALMIFTSVTHWSPLPPPVGGVA